MVRYEPIKENVDLSTDMYISFLYFAYDKWVLGWDDGRRDNFTLFDISMCMFNNFWYIWS